LGGHETSLYFQTNARATVRARSPSGSYVKTYDEDDRRIYRGYQIRHRDKLLEKRSFLWRTLGYVMNFLSRNCANGRKSAAADTQCYLRNSLGHPE
jgi:predicted SPOUT superfamily RNA methylase MTH1